MAANPPYGITIPASSPLYRITPIYFETPNPVHHKKVVNGMGARKSQFGARYNHGGVLTVYLADTAETCFAEKMFYFHRETVQRLDALHLPNSPGVPLFSATFTLWEIRLKNAVDNVCHLTQASASAFGVFPSLMHNPSQDYFHLKDRRGIIENRGYNGIKAPSSRSVTGGEILVLFDDQSKNVFLNPHRVEFRLVTRTPILPFSNHLTQVLDFTTGEVRFVGGTPPGLTGNSGWTSVAFNH